MILTLSIFGLVLVLIAVIASQYYMSKEAFANEKRNSRHNNASDACANVSDSTPITEVPVACLQKVFLDVGCTAAGNQFPKEKMFKSQWATFGEFRKAFSEAIKNAPKTDPDFIKACAPAMPNQLDSLDACSGIPDSTPTEQVPIGCIQSQWKKLGCKKDAIGYPVDSDNVISSATKGMNFGNMKMIVDSFIKDNDFSKDENLRLLCHASTNDITSGNKSAIPPTRNDVRPQIEVSDTGYAAMQGKQKSDLLQSIQKIVRNELLANRATQPTLPNKKDDDNCDDDCNEPDSHCTAQGDEFKKVTPKRMSKGSPNSSDPCDASDQPKNSAPKPYKSNIPDMSKYIKKDSIPCWGCSLDY